MRKSIFLKLLKSIQFISQISPENSIKQIEELDKCGRSFALDIKKALEYSHIKSRRYLQRYIYKTRYYLKSSKYHDAKIEQSVNNINDYLKIHQDRNFIFRKFGNELRIDTISTSDVSHVAKDLRYLILHNNQRAYRIIKH